MTDDLSKLAAKLTKAQRHLVISSDPGGWGRDDCATGVEIRGAQYRAAEVLARLGVGTYSHGSPYSDLYFNTGLGLALRAHLEQETDDA